MEYLKDEIYDVQLENSDDLFANSERIMIFGSSNSGKSTFVYKLVKKFHHRFERIIICGSGNQLLFDQETKSKTTHFEPPANASGDELLYNPFEELSIYELKKISEKNKSVLIIYDDMQEILYSSSLISRIYSQGRHRNLSIITNFQSFFVTGQSKSLLPQIKANASVMIFMRTKSHSEISAIADRIECSKDDKLFFIALFKKIILSKKYGYLAVCLDVSDIRLKYQNNFFGEDSTDFRSVYIKS